MSDLNLIKALRDLEREALAAISNTSALTELESLRVTYLGRSGGRISGILRGLGGLSPGERPTVGQEANRVKTVVKGAIEERGRELTAQDSEGMSHEQREITLPARGPWRGGMHPVTEAVNEIWKIFRNLGFARVRGPEADTEWYNFEALNTPLDHPAADEQDTLYLVESVLLRSHTSPVQVRTMEAHDPPIRVIAPGWVYRRDTYDATHTPAFLQVEGLVINESSSFAEMKGTLEYFAKEMFGKDTKMRFRPSYFPFTEPSAEVDIWNDKLNQWMEILGCGMVNPNVLENVGYDSEKYQGFAFGMGIERIAMIKYGIRDIRLFYQNDKRFLEQF